MYVRIVIMRVSTTPLIACGLRGCVAEKFVLIKNLPVDCAQAMGNVWTKLRRTPTQQPQQNQQNDTTSSVSEESLPSSATSSISQESEFVSARSSISQESLIQPDSARSSVSQESLRIQPDLATSSISQEASQPGTAGSVSLPPPAQKVETNQATSQIDLQPDKRGKPLTIELSQI